MEFRIRKFAKRSVLTTLYFSQKYSKIRNKIYVIRFTIQICLSAER